LNKAYLFTPFLGNIHDCCGRNFWSLLGVWGRFRRYFFIVALFCAPFTVVGHAWKWECDILDDTNHSTRGGISLTSSSLDWVQMKTWLSNVGYVCSLDQCLGYYLWLPNINWPVSLLSDWKTVTVHHKLSFGTSFRYIIVRPVNQKRSSSLSTCGNQLQPQFRQGNVIFVCFSLGVGGKLIISQMSIIVIIDSRGYMGEERGTHFRMHIAAPIPVSWLGYMHSLMSDDVLNELQ
jgi:hypothetical protein